MRWAATRATVASEHRANRTVGDTTPQPQSPPSAQRQFFRTAATARESASTHSSPSVHVTLAFKPRATSRPGLPIPTRTLVRKTNKAAGVAALSHRPDVREYVEDACSALGHHFEIVKQSLHRSKGLCLLNAACLFIGPVVHKFELDVSK